MTPEQFAIDCGCIVKHMTPEEAEGWGGRWAYTSTDHPNMTTCGFRTEAAAYKGFLEETFGKQPTKALLKLLKNTGETK